jgi:hypothetical protein
MNNIAQDGSQDETLSIKQHRAGSEKRTYFKPALCEIGRVPAVTGAGGTGAVEGADPWEPTKN